MISQNLTPKNFSQDLCLCFKKEKHDLNNYLLNLKLKDFGTINPRAFNSFDFHFIEIT